MIEENEKMKLLAIKDFAKKVISDGHLFLQSGGGRKFYLMRPGLLVDPGFVKKHAALQTNFLYQSVIDIKKLNKFSNLFKEWKYLQFEKDFRMKSIEILAVFRETYEEKCHFLNFALACFNEFNQIPNTDLINMHEADVYLFQKSMYSGAFAVLIALANDYYNYQMVKDFYNISLALDMGLSESNFTYFVAEACNRENELPGTGHQWLKDQKASESEIKLFLEHPLKSAEYLKKNESILAFPELAEIVKYHHELSTGQGFPKGIVKSHFSSWEAVAILADSLVEIKPEHGFEEDAIGYVAKFSNFKLGQLPIQKVYSKLCISLDLVIDNKRGVAG